MRKFLRRKHTIYFVAGAAAVFLAASYVHSHCQIPCGIYGDDTRFEIMSEHIDTIEKSMKMIDELSAKKEKDMNQIVRWVTNKEDHAAQLSEIITYYFMAQRIKPVSTAQNDAQKELYTKQVTLLHEMLVTTMQTKQSTDLTLIPKLRGQLHDFSHLYNEKAE
ncbi:superoxide dismutase, Ni [Limihaloglobus sulfuriphilus]|uniref:Superoxide dismutase, Ni n=1 Tax=Limihaloglobus sulfuriphilus TaxID=1851148 RepID=A0A1Q2MFR2_9BACT|nr:superoxide dismutase [Ni] [Limihaloglobus sulfuriphilus]AQQ71546.1 superoxide dismutase, Ni [Limihaloglobus sulfuriphilus]